MQITNTNTALDIRLTKREAEIIYTCMVRRSNDSSTPEREREIFQMREAILATSRLLEDK